MKRYILAITGTTGVTLGLQLLKELLKTSEVHLIFSGISIPIIKEETGLDLSINREDNLKNYLNYSGDALHIYDEDNLWAPVASGSFRTEGMFVVPCSMKTLASIANGYASSLIERAADVVIKEGRRLILSPRETPLSPIHLENMLKLSRIGVKIVPPMFGFYHKPESIEELMDFIVGKILDQAGIENHLYRRWGKD